MNEWIESKRPELVAHFQKYYHPFKAEEPCWTMDDMKRFVRFCEDEYHGHQLKGVAA